MALLGVAQLMVVLDVTIVNIALPSAQKALQFSTDDRQWIITAYALTFGSLLLLGGKLGDLFGRKWTLVAGLLGFAGASAIGGLAPSFGVLVAARALQGSFGALLAPSALSLLTITFQDSPDRPKAFGIFSAIAASGTSVGLLLGGLLTETLSWRWTLYVNLLFAIPAAIAALRLVNGAGAQRPRPRIDAAGVGLASAGFFCLVYGFSNAESHAWSAGLTIAALTASAVLLACFAAAEHRTRHPLLPLHIVADRSRGGAYASMAVAGAALFSVFLFMTFYMQQILRFSPLKTGPRVPAADRCRYHHRALGPDQDPAPSRSPGRHRDRHDPGHHRHDHLHSADARRVLRQPGATGAHSRRDRSGLRLLRLVRHRHARRRSQ